MQMGNVRLYGATSGYTELAPPAVAPDGVLSLPSGTGTIATQSYVDTSSAAAGGLLHLNTSTFSSVTSHAIDSIFTSSYRNYRIIIDITSNSTSDASILFRFRTGGTASTSGYLIQGWYSYGTGSGVVYSASVAQWSIGNLFNSWQPANFDLNIYGPQLAANSGFIGVCQGAGGGAQTFFKTLSGKHLVSTSYDGFQLICDSGNMTGSVSVYGIRNS